MDPEALDALDGRQGAEKFSKGPSSVEVQPVVSCILRDNYKFPHALCGMGLGLCRKRCDRNRTVRAAYIWDGAVRAAAVTAFGNLEIGVGMAVSADPAECGLVIRLAAERLSDISGTGIQKQEGGPQGPPS